MATQQLTSSVTLKSGASEDVTDSTVYTSSDVSVASVDDAGLVTSHAAGQATITGTYGGLKDTVAVTVSAGTLAVLPEAVNLAPAATQQLAATFTPNGGAAQDVTAQAAYQSSNAAVATVNAAGLITAQAAGQATVTVTYQSPQGPVTDTVTVTVA